MIIRCAFEQVPELCAGLVKQGVTFTCYESSDGLWLITLMAVTDMQFAPTTAYIVDATTADKQELMAALAGVSGVVSVQDGGVYREDNAYSQVHIEALNAVWSLEQLDELLYSLNYDVVGIVAQ